MTVTEDICLDSYQGLKYPTQNSHDTSRVWLLLTIIFLLLWRNYCLSIKKPLCRWVQWTGFPFISPWHFTFPLPEENFSLILCRTSFIFLFVGKYTIVHGKFYKIKQKSEGGQGTGLREWHEMSQNVLLCISLWELKNKSYIVEKKEEWSSKVHKV